MIDPDQDRREVAGKSHDELHSNSAGGDRAQRSATSSGEGSDIAAEPGENAGPPLAGSAANNKEARDTVAGCRQLAAQDLTRAEGMGTQNARQVFERSAASWEKRADELDELEHGSQEQRRVDKALWDDEENGRAGPSSG